MISFDPRDPYPLLSPASHTYPEAQAHSREVDAWLGIDTERVEAALREGAATEGSHDPDAQHWIGLPSERLLTPYTELRTMLARLAPEPGQLVIDCGAAYGRMGFVLAAHHAGVRFVGYECVAERVTEGQAALLRHKCYEAKLELADLSDPSFDLLPADLYFIYDFGSRSAIDRTLEDLRGIARRRPIRVVCRGRASRDAAERRHPWLTAVVPPEHEAHYSIYRSA